MARRNFIGIFLSSLLPKSLKSALIRNIIYSQMKIHDIETSFSLLIISAIIISIVAAILVFDFTSMLILAIITVPLLYLVILFLVESILSLIAGRVGEQIEAALPDMLLLMAANLRAGMVPENSFIESMRPQFGKLNNLLREAAIDVQSGENFRNALLNMSDKTSSKFFKETIKIIADAIRAGGELHLTLENLADNLLQSEALRRSMKAQVRTYSLFIFIAAVLAAPLLYGVASLLIGILDKVSASVGSSTVNVPSVGLSIFSSFTLTPVPVNLVLMISIIDVVITTSSSAIIQGVLNTGNARDGLTSLPVYLLIGLGIFFAVRFFLNGMFASLLVGGASSI